MVDRPVKLHSERTRYDRRIYYREVTYGKIQDLTPISHLRTRHIGDQLFVFLSRRGLAGLERDVLTQDLVSVEEVLHHGTTGAGQPEDSAYSLSREQRNQVILGTTSGADVSLTQEAVDSATRKDSRPL
jgi:hypothetical protein